MTNQKTIQDVEVSIQTITPEDAAVLLQANTNNRSVNRRRVDIYTNEILRDEWKFTGDSIKLAKDPKTGQVRLIDGQHRLLAIVAANKALTLVVATGLDESVFSVIDRGKVRSHMDILGMGGVKNANTVSAVVRPLIVLGAKMSPWGKAMELVTSEDIMHFAKTNEELVQWACNRSFKMREHLSGSGTAWAIFMYLLADKHGAKCAEDFTDSLMSGVGFTAGDPRAALRNWVVRSFPKLRNLSRASYDVACMMIRAYNLTVEGQQIAQMRMVENNGIWPEISTKKFKS